MSKLIKCLAVALILLSGITAANAAVGGSYSKNSLTINLSDSPGYQLAKSYWLGGADIDLGFKGDDDATVCNSMGYFQKDCQDNKSPLQRCPYNQAYFKCSCDTSVYRYSTLNCSSNSSPDLSEENSCENYSNSCVCEGGKIWVVENNSCVDCLNDTNCGDNQKCQNNECVNVNLCENVSCTGGQKCNDTTGACECPSGEVFYNNRCEAPSCANEEIKCSGTADICNKETGKCVECLTASNCNANEICSGNTCQTVDRCKDVSCTSGSGKSCNPNNGQCECPSDKPYENNGTCEAPNCDNGGVRCDTGETCNTTTKVCEAVKEETCRTQAEAKGWTLITSEAEFTEALSAEKAKLAFSGNVRSRALSALVKASAATLADAATVVGGLCTEPGSIDLKALHTNTIMSIEVPGTIEFLSGGTNSEITLRADNFVVDKLSCTKSSNCLFNLKGEEVYIEELDAFPLSTIKVYGNAVGNRYYEEYETVLNDSTLYTTNIDMIKLQGGSNLTLYSGMAIGTIEMTGLSQSLTRLTFADGGFFISRPYKAEYQNSGTFLEAINCQYYMCQINVGEVSNASLNLNQRDLRFGITSGSYYNEGGNMYVYINSSVLKNVGSLTDASSSNKPHVHFTLNYYDLTPIIQFTNGDSISKPTEAVDWICNFDLSGRISSASQCTPTSATSGNIGTCKCNIK